MSRLMDAIIERARKTNKHIVLAEGEELRIIQAAAIIKQQNIAEITLLGNPDVILAKAEENSLNGVEIIDPANSPKRAEYAKLLYELRKEKGMTEEKAASLALDPLYYGCLMVKSGDADGMVAGSIHSTGDVLRPALQIIKSKPGIKTVSGCFIMGLPEGSPYGDHGVMIFADSFIPISSLTASFSSTPLSCPTSANSKRPRAAWRVAPTSLYSPTFSPAISATNSFSVSATPRP